MVAVRLSRCPNIVLLAPKRCNKDLRLPKLRHFHKSLWAAKGETLRTNLTNESPVHSIHLQGEYRSHVLSTPKDSVSSSTARKADQHTDAIAATAIALPIRYGDSSYTRLGRLRSVTFNTRRFAGSSSSTFHGPRKHRSNAFVRNDVLEKPKASLVVHLTATFMLCDFCICTCHPSYGDGRGVTICWNTCRHDLTITEKSSDTRSVSEEPCSFDEHLPSDSGSRDRLNMWDRDDCVNASMIHKTQTPSHQRVLGLSTQSYTATITSLSHIQIYLRLSVPLALPYFERAPKAPHTLNLPTLRPLFTHNRPFWPAPKLRHSRARQITLT